VKVKLAALATAAAAIASLVLAAVTGAQSTLRFETEDWIFEAPSSLGTQADLELGARQVQLCTDEIELLVGHRPTNVRKFRWSYVIGGGPVSFASTDSVTTLVPAGWTLVEPVARAFRENIVRQNLCFGPHEVTHVLTWESWGQAWANEGLATFTDRLYDSLAWRCCAAPVRASQTCDATGYTDGVDRFPYSDLSPFTFDFRSYGTAACFWFEVYRLGKLPAIRGILAGMRARPPVSTGAFIVHHVNRVLNVDLRPVAARYGFEPSELQVGPAPRIPGCTLIGWRGTDAIVGTAGPDVTCGLAGHDRLTGGAGADVLDGGPGNDALNAKDGRRDVVRGGPGRDSARIDRGLDRVQGVEQITR
jgi:RTX calcium-binding nonapeptide repeat (4 copies)